MADDAPKPPYAPSKSPVPSARAGATAEERARLDNALGAATRAEALVEQLEHRLELAEDDIRTIQAEQRAEARRIIADSRAELAATTGAHKAVEVARRGRLVGMAKWFGPPVAAAIFAALASQWRHLIDWLKGTP